MVFTRSQTRQRKAFDPRLYEDLVDRIPGMDKDIMAYVGPVRNAYTSEQLIAPCVLKKRAAVDALDDWYGREPELFDIYHEHVTREPLILLLAFNIWLHGALH